MNEEDADERIHPFTVKDALYLHDKRIGDTQRIVGSFEDKFKVLMERINEGVSPTMRRIEGKQSDIEKQIVQVDSKIDVKFSELKSEIKVLNNHFSDRFTEFDRVMGGWRGLQWKIIGSVVVGGAGVFLSMWIYVQQIKDRLQDLPRATESRKK